MGRKPPSFRLKIVPVPDGAVPEAFLDFLRPLMRKAFCKRNSPESSAEDCLQQALAEFRTLLSARLLHQGFPRESKAILELQDLEAVIQFYVGHSQQAIDTPKETSAWQASGDNSNPRDRAREDRGHDT